MTGDWRKERDEDLQDWYFPRSIFRVIISRWIRLSGHVADLMKKVHKCTQCFSGETWGIKPI